MTESIADSLCTLSQLESKFDEENLEFRSERVTWYRPTSLDELLRLKTEHPSARLVVGNTEVGKYTVQSVNKWVAKMLRIKSIISTVKPRD